MRPFPDVVRIEPAGRCNYKCTHCPVGVEGGKRNLLSFENFCAFFEMLPIVPRVLVLYHGGEPLLNRDLEKMIAYAKGLGVCKTVLNTNASLLSERRDFSQLDEMRVSFDGTSAVENDAIRINSHFWKYANEVRRLAKSNKRPKQITIYNAGTGRIADYLIDYFADSKVLFQGVKLRTWARVGSKPMPTNGVTFCSNLFETFTILSNGDVPMCCEDLLGEDIQGNVFANTPLEIWQRMKTRRDAFAKADYPNLCQSCWVVTQ